MVLQEIMKKKLFVLCEDLVMSALPILYQELSRFEKAMVELPQSSCRNLSEECLLTQECLTEIIILVFQQFQYNKCYKPDLDAMLVNSSLLQYIRILSGIRIYESQRPEPWPTQFYQVYRNTLKLLMQI